ncbi:MEKHLA domain-containing protein [Dyadobacter sp. SG02]|uniref:MEKHLA domain-containing protein n=1 Tax=Dyadobacter sp. SG02 TaxID=1855291 RepID=UPI0008CB296A|nr:MEKHLA domain-containing protein [Dyadobacter sp. SG02]SEI56471.1 MEKHLA domain-containing protein [Dyadobacter sp. SG02]
MTPAQNDALIRQINESFHRLSGQPLYAPGAAAPGAAAREAPDVHQWLHEEAPYAILAHNTDADPRFIYANAQALASFKYSQEEILAVPSRLSASQQDRPERQRMLEIVLRDGIVYNYSGPRVDKYGNSFMIYDGIVWQLRDADGQVFGQAALFWPDEVKRPDWFRPVRH